MLDRLFRLPRAYLALGLSLIPLGGSTATAQSYTFTAPQSGEVYREFTRIMRVNNRWRVTDPNASASGTVGNNPGLYLPNPSLPLEITDLQDAVRAEAVMTIWGGHIGTTGKQFRFNGNSWIDIPELSTTPGSGQCYAQQWDIVVDVPLADLSSGTNFFEGTTSGQSCYNVNWGQWGWYTMTIRVYYDPALKSHPTGTISSHTSGATFGENPLVSVSPISSGPAISEIQILAYCDAYDTDGDGQFEDWQRSYHRESSDNVSTISNHVGTVTNAPYETTWDTSLVPDQMPQAVRLQARIADVNGYWYVTPVVDALTFQRTGTSVHLYKPYNVPDNFVVAAGSTKISNIGIPADLDLAEALEAKLLVRTWNGQDGMAEVGELHHTKVNGDDIGTFGQDHYHSYDQVTVSTSTLINGENVIEFHSDSSHHGIEILWPGPAMLVLYNQAPTPSIPTGLTAVATAASGIDLDWDDNVEPNVGYTVYRSTSAGFTPAPANMLAFNVQGSAFADTGLVETTTYYYRVAAKRSTSLESATTGEASTTTLTDTVAPTLISALANANSMVHVLFSEELDFTTSTDTSNYSLTGSMGAVSILGAFLNADERTATLTVAPLVDGGIYTLTVSGIHDQALIPNVAAGQFEFTFDNGLITHWPFDDGVGSVASTTGIGLSGSISGAQWTADTADGSVFSLDFDGIDDAVDIGAIDVEGHTLTFAMWVKPDSFAVSDGRLISKATGLTDDDHYWMLSTIYSGGENRIRFRLKTGGTTSTLVATGGELLPGVWSHVAATYDGAFMRLFKDGIFVGSLPKTGMIETSAFVTGAVGNQPPTTGNRPFDGHIDDVRIYSIALSGAEIADLAEGNHAPVATPDQYNVVNESSLVVNAAQGVLINDSDPDAHPFTASLVSDATSGTVVLSDDGSFTYVPPALFVGSATFVYSAVDQGGLASAGATVSIDVESPDCNSNGTGDNVDISGGSSPDCNTNGIPDECDLASGFASDINSNSVPDSCEPDCNANGVPDAWDISTGAAVDCNTNGLPDSCDIAGGAADVNSNSIPDSCEPDCDGNGLPDAWEVSQGTASDCNSNGLPDTCDIAGASLDLNSNGIPDECEGDCNSNSSPDDHDIATGTSLDCNTNGIPDECDLSSGAENDANSNSIPDSCEPDCNANGVPDAWDISTGAAVDCNTNGLPDSCDIAGGAADVNSNSIPDSCEPDCDFNGLPDNFEIGSGMVDDCNINGIPDMCDLVSGVSSDHNGNGTPDDCETDCNMNGVPDELEVSAGFAPDCNSNGMPDSCDILFLLEVDVDGNGIPDSCEDDCNSNGIPDGFDISSGNADDVNANGVPDTCDISSGSSLDTNANGIPDEAECAGVNFCSANVNTTGGAAKITATGSCVIADNNFSLNATPVPPQPGTFFYSNTQSNGGAGIPFGNGRRCIGGNGAQVYRLPVLQNFGNTLSYTLNMNAPNTSVIVPGSTWNFQAWFRDPVIAGFNLSDAILVTFQ